MTTSELIRELENFPEDTEVRLAMQPAWPFEYSISDVVSFNSQEHTWLEDKKYIDPDDEESMEEWRSARPDTEDVCYLIEGEQLAYLSKDIFS